mgnify:FL=1
MVLGGGLVALGWIFRAAVLGGGAAGAALAIVVPIFGSALALAITTLVRRSTRVRVSNRSVEMEAGVLARKVDVLELWRVRDLRYRQSLWDRLLGIGHIEIFTKDVTSPHVEIVGVTDARGLFNGLRDAIDIQRQSKRVLGIVD